MKNEIKETAISTASVESPKFEVGKKYWASTGFPKFKFFTATIESRTQDSVTAKIYGDNFHGLRNELQIYIYDGVEILQFNLNRTEGEPNLIFFSAENFKAKKVTMAKKLYKVYDKPVADDDDEERPIEFNKLSIYAYEKGINVDMFVECKTLSKAYDKFAKAFNQAIDDGIIDNEVYGRWESYKEWKASTNGEYAVEDDACWGYGEYPDGSYHNFQFEDLGEHFYIYYRAGKHNVEVQEVKETTIENAARVLKADYLVRSMSKYGVWATFKYETLQDAARSVAGIFEKDYYRGEVAVEVTNFQSDVLYSWELNKNNFPTLAEIEQALNLNVGLENQLSEVQESISINESIITDNKKYIAALNKRIIKALANIADYENEIANYAIECLERHQHNEEFQAEAEKLQAEITNRKLNAAAVEMVDDGSNEEDAETLTVDYNFDVEEDDDELVDPPIEYHIEFEFPAAVELEPVTFALERFGDDEVDEDAEIKALKLEIAEIDALIKSLKAKSAAKSDLIAQKCKSVIDWAYSELDKVADKYDKDFIKINRNDGKIIKLYKDVDGRDEYKLANENECWEYLIIEFSRDFETKSDFIRICKHTLEIARYSNVKNFKAAVREFVSAIERGDEEFTFPADSAKNTVNA